MYKLIGNEYSDELINYLNKNNLSIKKFAKKARVSFNVLSRIVNEGIIPARKSTTDNIEKAMNGDFVPKTRIMSISSPYKRVGKAFNDKLINYLNKNNITAYKFALEFGYDQSLIIRYVKGITPRKQELELEIMDIIENDLWRKY